VAFVQEALNEAPGWASRQRAKTCQEVRSEDLPDGSRAIVPLDKALSVADAIEDEELSRKLSMRK